MFDFLQFRLDKIIAKLVIISLSVLMYVPYMLMCTATKPWKKDAMPGQIPEVCSNILVPTKWVCYAKMMCSIGHICFGEMQY